MDTVIFAPDLIEYAFLGVSLTDAKVILEECIQMIQATRFTNVCARHIGILALYGAVVALIDRALDL